MTNKNYFAIAMMIIAMMMNVNNANAQGRRHDMSAGHGANREMMMDNGYRGGYNDRGGYRNDRGPAVAPHHAEPHMHAAPAPHHHDMVPHHPAPHHLDRYGYVPGWEGRVRYHQGRWGYLRGSDWYWYDRYYEPAYYFGHPVAHFHAHHVPLGAKVAGAVAGAVVVGALISALAH